MIELHGIKNAGKNRLLREHCPYCCDEGLVLVGYQLPPYGEEVGPCPRCERGGRYAAQEPWHGQFWNERPASGIEQSCRCFEREVTADREANQKRVVELMRKLW